MERFEDLEKARRRLNSRAGKAIGDYGLIADGDVVAVGVSGGKDSLLLVKFLADLRRRAPVRYKLGALHLGGAGEEALAAWLRAQGLDFLHLEAAPHVPEVEGYVPGGPSPCFACARARRNRLFGLCRRYGAHKLALGHHLDDALETFLLNVFYSGRDEGLAPRETLFGGDLTLIRPLILTPEALIRRLAAAWALPVKKNPCPADGHTRRQDMKELVARLAAANGKIYGNLAAVAVGRKERDA